MRGPGCGEAIQTARRYTGTIDLRRFRSRSRTGFLRRLDEATNELLYEMPRSARSWGLVRKGLNIFLKECLYCYYLREPSGIDRVERYLELPLDSLTGAALMKTDESLPRWSTVRGLTPSLSEQFQDAAAREGDQRGLARVHLDAFWWGHRGAGV